MNMYRYYYTCMWYECVQAWEVPSGVMDMSEAAAAGY